MIESAFRREKLGWSVAKKVRIGLTLDPSVVKRVDRVAKAQRKSRSAWIETACLDQLSQAEMFVKMTQQPELASAFARAFGDPSVMRRMAEVMGQELTDDQLDLFTVTLDKLTEGQPKSKRRGRA